MPPNTRGLRHVHLMVSDHDRSYRFYKNVFGMEVGFEVDNTLALLGSRFVVHSVAFVCTKSARSLHTKRGRCTTDT